MSLAFWEIADAVERLRTCGLDTDRIAITPARTATQVVGVEIIAYKVRE